MPRSESPSSSRGAASEFRPLLVVVLGTAWLILCSFGLIRGTLAVSGLSEGVEWGSADPNEELARTNPEWVDPSWFEHKELEAQRQILARRLGWPLLAISVLGAWGAVRMLRRRAWSRTLILLAGIGSIGLTAAGAYLSMRLELAPVQNLELPPEIPETFWTVAGLNVAIQSLPVVIGLSLLRHPSVRRWVRIPADQRGAKPAR